ncbi:hypothetical protein CDAR_200181 [Caerostris darwini]|uniref:Uncharacterized protein n=1 Tax=Caerostris darwini TaxID=1538125 RepID=A0AAV4PMB6_9ARAC|nr:hypothetical protein CDAR_200181 [Caerostris darwini]
MPSRCHCHSAAKSKLFSGARISIPIVHCTRFPFDFYSIHVPAALWETYTVETGGGNTELVVVVGSRSSRSCHRARETYAMRLSKRGYWPEKQIGLKNKVLSKRPNRITPLRASRHTIGIRIEGSPLPDKTTNQTPRGSAGNRRLLTSQSEGAEPGFSVAMRVTSRRVLTWLRSSVLICSRRNSYPKDSYQWRTAFE